MHVTDVFHKPLLSHRTSQQTIFSQCSGERQNIFEKLQQYHPAPHTPNGNIHPHIIIHSLFFPPSPLTLFHFLGNFLTSWTLPFLGHSFPLGPYFSSFLWGPFNSILLQFVGLHPTVTIRLISGRACLGVSAIKSRSRLLPITHAQLITSCPFNLSVGQSCLHFISPLISNYPPQYPKVII